MSIRLSRRLWNRSLSSSAGLGTRWGRIGLSPRFERESQPRRRRKTLLDLAHEIASFLADQAQIQAIPNTLRRQNPPIFPGAQSFSRATSYARRVCGRYGRADCVGRMVEIILL